MLNFVITSPQSEWSSSKYVQTINVIEGMEKKKPSSMVGGNENWYNYYLKQNRVSFKELNIEILYDSTFPLLGIYIRRKPYFKRHMYLSVHQSTLYNGQHMEAI